MRKLLFILFISFSFLRVDATHLMGGEITWECIKDPASPDLGKYIFTMKLYRDCDGTTLSQFAETIQVWADGVNFQNINCDFISNTDISPLCDVANSGNAQLDCYGFNPAGAVEEYVYQSLPVQLIGTPPATGWHFTWDLCCRNGAIVNLLNPDTQGFTLRATMYPYTDPITGLVLPADPCFDSSPVFNESPKTIICSGYPFAYSHNASDPEIDSIRYYWAEPLDDGFFAYDPDPANFSPAAIPFVGGFTFNSPIPGAPALNPVSGEISYNSNTAGNFVTVTRVESFKCGQKIAEIHRDIQVVLIACPTMPGGTQNDPPVVPAPVGAQTWTVDPLGSSLLPSYETTVTAGEFISFNILGIDSNLYNGVTPQDITMEVSGGQILDPNTGSCQNEPCATFVSPTGAPSPIIGPGIVEGIFEWQTTCDHVSTDVACGRTTNLYQFSVKVYDDFCPAPAIRSVTLMVYVEANNDMQISDVQPSCFGNDGVITIEPSLSITQVAWDAELYDLFGNLVDSVNNVSGTSASLTGLGAGDYVVRAVGAGGCLVQDSIQLLEAPNPLNIEINTGHVSCYGGSNGQIGITLDNGLEPYSYFINGVQNSIPPPGDSIFSALSEGVYIITAIDSDSCGLRDTITIEAPQFPLQVLSSNSVIICDNNSNGSAIGLAAGGSPYSDGHYNFDWYTANGGFFGDLVGSGDSISILSLGDYFLQVTDSNGCQANIPINVSPQQLPVIISPNLFEIVCKGDSSGSAIAFAGGGTAPYDYVWSVQNGDTIEVVNDISISDTLFGLTSGTYDLVVTDSDGCTDEMTYFFNEPNIALEIESVEVVDSIDCFGDLDGRALVSMVSGSGELPYSYLWDNGEATFLANSLSGGWHTITVTDARGCVVVDSVLIPENPIIETTLDITNPVSCYGYNDAEITATSFGGSSSTYTYLFSYLPADTSGFSSFVYTSLSFGSYYMTTRDALGCVVIDSIFLPEPSPLYVNAEEVLEVSCYGDSTGTATVYGVGGTLPYTFEWQNNNIVSSPLDSSATETTLFYGEETVLLTDARGCTITDTVMIHQPDLLDVTISNFTLAYCVGVNTASATASVVGGTVPYTYVWDDNSVVPQTTAIASNLDYGFYSVVVTDHRGCTASVSVDLEDYEAPLSVSIDVVSTISCYGDSDGELAVSTNGTGTAPFTYQWITSSGSNSNATISNLSQGTYSVTVVDANGCAENAIEQLTVPDPLLYKVVSSVDAECLGACDGEMELYIEGGKVPYFAELVDNQSGISSIFDVEASDSSTVLNVCTGDYTVLVTDDNGCDGSVILGGSNQMTLDITISTDVTANIDQLVVCYGDSTGVISVTSPNQDTSYTYMWTNLNGDTLSYSSEIDSLFIGDYILYSGYNGIEGCTTVDTISLIQNALIYSSAVITNVSCYGGNDGIIALVTSGGTGPYEYSWSPVPFFGDTVPGLFAGSYNVTITDTSSCSQTQTYNVTEPTLLTASVTSSQTYILNTTATGGTSPYFYSWIEQSQPGVELGASDSYVVGAAGIYYVVVTDDNGCESQSNSTTFVQTGILDVASLQDLSIYPNPFRNETTVDFGRVVEDAKITVVDIYGKVIEKYEINDTDKYIIKRATKASGVYFLEVEIGSTKTNTKIIIR